MTDYTELANDIMSNFPESALCLSCRSWKYEDGVFEFYDPEENKTYIITIAHVKEALPKFIREVDLGHLHFYGITPANIYDACNWDAPISDALVQFTIFGEVIYG